jgi:hypothetical protein
MNKLNDIFKMISQMEKNAEEVKLGKHEVELSVKDDAKELVTKYFRLTDNINSDFTGVSKEIRGIIEKIGQAEKLANDMPKVIAKYEGLAKELGIDINNIQELKDLKLAVKDVAQYKGLATKLKSI